MKDVKSYFKDRNLFIASMHKKEKVIKPLLEENLEVNCVISDNFNTDLFGTFSGEIERKNDAISTLRNKCMAAIEQFKCDLVVASEGSFGPHPEIFFQSANQELVMLIDVKNNLEIIGQVINCDTNYSGSEITNIYELKEFCDKTLFPTHALIIKKSKNETDGIIKGITEKSSLINAVENLFDLKGSAYLETDMRAMYNPTRMRNIEKATINLIQNICSLCPVCSTPGFRVVKLNRGLKCEACGSPTNSVISHRYTCEHCNHSEEKQFPDGKTAEDPMYCQMCNP
ncbi:MAG: hypothetical protein KDC13_06435 [Bacteroidetes bacterium]|nr:hypothetical protein [Bacteroidota bacterium]